MTYWTMFDFTELVDLKVQRLLTKYPKIEPEINPIAFEIDGITPKR